MRPLPVPDPGTPDLRSARRFLLWLMTRQALLGLGVATAVTGILRHRRVVSCFLDAAYRVIQLITGQAITLGNTLARLLSTGEVISVGTADVEALGSAIDVTGRGSGAVAALIVVAVILLSRSVPLGLIVLIGGPAMTAVVAVLLRPLHKRQQRYRDLQGQLSSRAADIVAGLRVLRGIGGEPAFSARYRAQSQDLRRTGVHVARTESFLAGAEILLPGMFVTVATWIAAHYALHAAITSGQLVTFYAYTSFLALPLATLTEVADKVVRGLVGASRVITILRLRPDVTDPASPSPWPAGGAILRDPASGLTAAPGELLGLAADDPVAAAALADRIGRYGPVIAAAHERASRLSGPELGGPELGGPELGGVPLADLPVAALRSHVLIAENGAHLFAGRLDEQLAGASAVSAPAARAAIAAAAAQDVLDAVPGGLDGQLAARGRTLSGGQAQRLRLIRALLADPEVLVLVEPTSAVDAHTEARIASGLREARQGRTTVVITNSPLLLDQADRVAFMRDGQVAAQGTHAQLLSESPEYASAVTRGGEA